MTADPDNPLVLTVLHASSTAYSFSPDEDITEVIYSLYSPFCPYLSLRTGRGHCEFQIHFSFVCAFVWFKFSVLAAVWATKMNCTLQCCSWNSSFSCCGDCAWASLWGRCITPVPFVCSTHMLLARTLCWSQHFRPVTMLGCFSLVPWTCSVMSSLPWVCRMPMVARGELTVIALSLTPSNVVIVLHMLEAS